MFTNFDKAIAAFLTPLILSLLAQYGVVPEMTVGEALPLVISALVIAAMVWLVPNRR